MESKLHEGKYRVGGRIFFFLFFVLYCIFSIYDHPWPRVGSQKQWLNNCKYGVFSSYQNSLGRKRCKGGKNGWLKDYKVGTVLSGQVLMTSAFWLLSSPTKAGPLRKACENPGSVRVTFLFQAQAPLSNLQYQCPFGQVPPHPQAQRGCGELKTHCSKL